MSRARTLAGAIGSDGALNVADVAGLAAVASSGSASDLSTGTLPIARIADGAVTSAKIADSAVTSGKIADGTIVSGDIADSAITTAKINAGAVTSAKLASGAAASNLGYSAQRGEHFYVTCRNGAYYSRVFRMGVGPLYASALVSIAHTRNSVVIGSTWIVSGGHSNGGRIAQIEGHHYTGGYKVAIEGNGNNDWWFCIHDNAYNPDGQTYSDWEVCVIPLVGSLTNTYVQSYTPGDAGNIRAELTAGQVVYTSNGSTSDERLKSNVQPIENALEKVLALNGYTFDLFGQRELGLMAQQMLSLQPELVTGYPGSEVPENVRQGMIAEGAYTLGLKYGNISALLVEAMKSQHELITELQLEVAALKGN